MISFGIDAATLVYNKIVTPEQSVPTTPNNLTASVIIPAYNEEATIEQAVMSHLKQTLKPKYILIADDCSTDATPSICKRLQRENPSVFHYRPNKKRGKAANINCIVESGGDDLGDICLVADGDAEVEQDCLENLVKGFTDPDVAAVTANGYLTPPNNLVSRVLYQGKDWLNSMFIFRKRAQGMRNAVFVINGACTAYRTSVLMEIPIPERTKTEDTDHTWLLEENGYRVVFSEQAMAHAPELENPLQHYKQALRWYSGTWQCVYTHGLRNLSKAKPLLYSTIIPSSIEGIPYAIALVGLPLWAKINPTYATGFLMGDFTLTVGFTALLGPRHLKNMIGIYAYKYLSGLAFIHAGLKTTKELIFGQKEKWSNTWKREGYYKGEKQQLMEG